MINELNIWRQMLRLRSLFSLDSERSSLEWATSTLRRHRQLQREIPSRRILPRFQLIFLDGNSSSRTLEAIMSAPTGFASSSMECAIIRMLPSICHRPLAIINCISSLGYLLQREIQFRRILPRFQMVQLTDFMLPHLLYPL